MRIFQLFNQCLERLEPIKHGIERLLPAELEGEKKLLGVLIPDADLSGNI